jgi:hypothetical protein
MSLRIIPKLNLISLVLLTTIKPLTLIISSVKCFFVNECSIRIVPHCLLIVKCIDISDSKTVIVGIALQVCLFKYWISRTACIVNITTLRFHSQWIPLSHFTAYRLLYAV